MGSRNQYPDPGYQWAKWFNRRKFTLVRGKQYTCMPHSIAVMARQQALKHKVRVRVEIKEEKVTVTVLGPNRSK